MFSNEALTGFEVKITPVGMRPDYQAAQRQVRGQQPFGQLQQRLALAFNAVEIALVSGLGHIDHEQCLVVKLVGKSSHRVEKAAAVDIFDGWFRHSGRLKKSTVHSRQKRRGGLTESDILGSRSEEHTSELQSPMYL